MLWILVERFEILISFSISEAEGEIAGSAVSNDRMAMRWLPGTFT
jgi:hypothetical protein